LQKHTLNNMQQYGMDYEETFAPVAKMTTIHALVIVSGTSLNLMLKVPS